MSVRGIIRRKKRLTYVENALKLFNRSKPDYEAFDAYQEPLTQSDLLSILRSEELIQVKDRFLAKINKTKMNRMNLVRGWQFSPKAHFEFLELYGSALRWGPASDARNRDPDSLSEVQKRKWADIILTQMLTTLKLGRKTRMEKIRGVTVPFIPFNPHNKNRVLKALQEHVQADSQAIRKLVSKRRRTFNKKKLQRLDAQIARARNRMSIFQGVWHGLEDGRYSWNTLSTGLF